MKETISVNLASQAFTFDKDAYRRLKEYLDAIRRRLPAGDPEILNEVAARLAEIFRARLSSPLIVVPLQLVQGAMAVRKCFGFFEPLFGIFFFSWF